MSCIGLEALPPRRRSDASTSSFCLYASRICWKLVSRYSMCVCVYLYIYSTKEKASKRPRRLVFNKLHTRARTSRSFPTRLRRSLKTFAISCVWPYNEKQSMNGRRTHESPTKESRFAISVGSRIITGRTCGTPYCCSALPSAACADCLCSRSRFGLSMSGSPVRTESHLLFENENESDKLLVDKQMAKRPKTQRAQSAHRCRAAGARCRGVRSADGRRSRSKHADARDVRARAPPPPPSAAAASAGRAAPAASALSPPTSSRCTLRLPASRSLCSASAHVPVHYTNQRKSIT